jgi:hypothetical protein
MGETIQEYSVNVLFEAQLAWQSQRSQFSALPKTEQLKKKGTHPGAEEWSDRKVKQRYGSAFGEVAKQMGSDFGFIAALHCRVMQLWQTKGATGGKLSRLTDQASPANLTSLIFPDGFMERSRRSRTIHWLGMIGHFKALIERGDYVGIAKCLRHLEAGVSL